MKVSLPREPKQGRAPIRPKMLVPIIIVNIITMIMLNVGNYIILSQTVFHTNRNNFVEYSQKNILLSLDNIDRQIIDSMNRIPAQYFAPIASNKPLLLPQEKDISAAPADVLALKRRLSEVFAHHPSVVGIDIYYPKTNTIATSAGFLHYNASPTERSRYLPWYDAFERAGINLGYAPLGANSYPSSPPTITYITKIPALSTQLDRMVVGIHISPKEFSSYINEETGHLLLVNGSGALLYETKGDTAYFGDMQQYLQEKSQRPADLPSSLAVTLQGEPVVVTVKEASTMDVYYYYIMPEQVFFQGYRPMLQAMILGVLVTLVTNLLGMILLTYKNNRTYHRRVLNVSQKTGLPLQENAKSLDESLAALTDHIHSMRTDIERSQPLLEQNRLRSLLLGKNSSQAFEQLAEELPYDSLCAVILCFEVLTDAPAHLEALAVRSKAEAPSYRLFLTSLQNNEHVAILNLSKEGFSQAFAAFSLVLQDADLVPRYYRGQLLPVTEAHFKACWDSAKEVFRYRYIFPTAPFLSPEQLDLPALKTTGSHLPLFNKIEQAILLDDIALCHMQTLLLVEAFRTGNYSIDYCLSTLRDFVSLLYRIMVSFRLDTWILFGEDIRESFHQVPDLDEFQHWIFAAVDIIIQQRLLQKESIDTSLRDNLSTLITENLENDISLDFLADAVGMRADVLSRAFKDTMGEGYTQYVKDRKMNRSLEFLAEGMLVKDIARRLGYSSTPYFIRVFKSTYGDTPYQYYKNNR